MPEFYHNIGPLWCLISFALLMTISLGVLQAWHWLAPRLRLAYHSESIFVNWAIALLAVPFLIFPLHFLAAIAGFYRPTTLVVQGVLAALALQALLKTRVYRQLWLELKQVSFLTVLCALTVCLFIYWPFVMPFPESFNGHHHILVNMIERFWQRGNYVIMPPHHVSYDNDIYTWPANLAFFLSLFSFPYIPDVGEHVIYMVPGLFAFLTWRLLRVLCSKWQIPDRAGDLGFLLIAFGYYSTSDFTAIHFDTLSPLFCVLFVLTMTEVIRKRGEQWIPYLGLLLAMTFLVRKQVFPILLFSLIIAAILLAFRMTVVRLVLRELHLRCLTLTFILAIPALFWASFVFAVYGSPFFPHDTSLTARLFTPVYHSMPIGDGPPTEVTSGVGRVWHAIVGVIDTVRNARTPDGTSFYMEHFLPLGTAGSAATLARGTFLGISNSFILVACIMAFGVLLLVPAFCYRSMAPLFGMCLGGFISAGMLLFMTYHKYPHYLGYIGVLFSVTSVQFLSGRLGVAGGRRVMNMLGGAIFGTGMLFWAFSSWGHGSHDGRVENIRFLDPYYGDFYMRLGRMTSRTPAEVKREVAEFQEAAGKGNILFMDHEPGALIPAILDAFDITTALFFDNPQAAQIRAAPTKADLKSALERLSIRFVCVPGRAHGSDGAFLMRLLRQDNRPHRYVVPVGELLHGS